MKVDVLLGLQWGDEGKGKIVDVLTPKYDIIARFQGGPNAGHTLEFEGRKHVLHTIPSGVFHKNCLNVIGNGVVIDPVIFKAEIAELVDHDSSCVDRIHISRKAHLILPTHRLLDAASEAAKGKEKIGSTLKGIGPTYMDKTGRNGLRIGDVESPQYEKRLNALIDKHLELLSHFHDGTDYKAEAEKLLPAWKAAIEELKQFTFIDSEHVINQALSDGKKVLAEGAQGSLLDIDFGSYPFVTSSNTICAGACTGLGIAPNKIGEVIGIFKAYCTRVGSGPFPTELENEEGERMRQEGGEFGATTGRPRRCGWLDMVALKYSTMINGVTQLVMTKADVLKAFEEIKVAEQYSTGKDLPYDISESSIDELRSFDGWNDLLATDDYSDLPDSLQQYIEYIEAETGVPISIVSLGPDRSETIVR